MVVLNRIYTHSADDLDVPRHRRAPLQGGSPRLRYGTWTKLNATIGLARLHTRDQRISTRARPHPERIVRSRRRPRHPRGAADTLAPRALRIVASQVERLEATSTASTPASRRCAPSSCRAARRSQQICTSPAPSAAGPSARSSPSPTASRSTGVRPALCEPSLGFPVRRRAHRQRGRCRRRPVGAGRDALTTGLTAAADGERLCITGWRGRFAR